MATSVRLDELKKKFDENPRRYFAPLANEYRKQGDLAQAITLCRTHLPNQPGHLSGHIVLAQTLYETRDLIEARQIFEAALDLDPENLIALRYLGDIAREQGAASTARAWYERVLEADPRNEEIAQLLNGLEGKFDAPAPAAALDLTTIPTPVATPAYAPPAEYEMPPTRAALQEDVADESAVETHHDSAPAPWDATTDEMAEPTAQEVDLPWSQAPVEEEEEVFSTDFSSFTDAPQSFEPSLEEPAATDAFAASSGDLAAAPELELDDWFAQSAHREVETPVEDTGADRFPHLDHSDIPAPPVSQPLDALFASEPETIAPASEMIGDLAEPRASETFADLPLEAVAGPMDAYEAPTQEWAPPTLHAPEPSPAMYAHEAAPTLDAQLSAPASDSASDVQHVDAATEDYTVSAGEPAHDHEFASPVAGEPEAPIIESRSDVVEKGAEESMSLLFGEWATDLAAPTPNEPFEATADVQDEPPVPTWEGALAPEQLDVETMLSGPYDAIDSSSDVYAGSASVAPVMDEAPRPAEERPILADPLLGRTPDLEVPLSEVDAAPFVTETMAELYVQQGFTDEALAIYRVLLSQQPHDQTLRDRIAALEDVGAPSSGSSPAERGPTVAEFFGRFARRAIDPDRASRGNGVDGAAEEGHGAAEANPGAWFGGAASASEALTVPDEQTSTLADLFASESVPAAEERAAADLASAFSGSTREIQERSTAGELSLQRLFGDVPAHSSGAVSPSDSIFSSVPVSSEAANTASEGGARRDTDIEQFTAWLEGLKKK
jgi:tetratricopeptide (TPR) repeat protein